MAPHKKGSNDENATETIHTPGGQARPAGREGPASDGADIASTDTSVDVGGDREPPAPSITQPSGQSAAEVAAAGDGAIDWKDRHLRLAAEFDNYKKRVNRERMELTDRAQADLVGRLLDELDDLDRLVASDRNATADALREGLMLIDRKLRKELGAAGVERIDPAGERFDPSVHEAVSVVPAPEPSLDHTVSATFQSGYRFKGQLLRAARVQVYSADGTV
jgi:molecular chaperone GrpE